jgi:hypothetical protein
MPDSVNPPAIVNRERSRDSAILDGVGTRKRAILDVDLAGRDEQLGAAVNKKPQKTRDLNEKSRDSRLGFLCLPDWLSFEPILKGSNFACIRFGKVVNQGAKAWSFSQGFSVFSEWMVAPGSCEKTIGAWTQLA